MERTSLTGMRSFPFSLPARRTVSTLSVRWRWAEMWSRCVTGSVYVNHRILPEPDLAAIRSHIAFPPRQLARNQLIVLGDNRDLSDDSLEW